MSDETPPIVREAVVDRLAHAFAGARQPTPGIDDTLIAALTSAVERLGQQTHEAQALFELVIVDLDHVLRYESIDRDTRERLERALIMARRGMRGDIRREPR